MLSPSHDEVAEIYLKDLAEAVAGVRGDGKGEEVAPTRYA